jgi:alpha-1,3-rhamnosyl/mannosyltransferase
VGLDLQLVLAGTDYRKEADLEFYETLALMQLGDAVRFVGSVPDRDLPALYTGARAVVYISIHEGFGLSALEALACGAALIISAGGALPELAGDAAMVVPNAGEPQAVAEALRQVLISSQIAERLRRCAIQRSQCFQLERNARETLDVYSNCVR